MKRTILGFSIFVFCLFPHHTFAQDVEESTPPIDQVVQEEPKEGEVKKDKEEKDLPLEANAGKDQNSLAGRTVLFDASATTGPENQEYTYDWDFGDGSTASGIDATHMYAQRGTYRVTLTVTSGVGTVKQITSTDQIFVSVQDRLLILLVDQSVSEDEVNNFQSYALTQGTLVILIRDSGVDQDYLTVQNLSQQLIEHQVDMAAADVIITWTNGNVGLDSLIELSRISALNGTKIEDFNFKSKAIVAINNQSLGAAAKIAQTTFQTIQPKYIVVSNSRILDDVVKARTPEGLEETLSDVDADYQLITEYTARGIQKLSFLNFMSYAVNLMINRGVPVNSLFLILMIPVMATIIAYGRQIVGVKAFGIFVPTVVALSFLATGLKYGIFVFIATIMVGTLARIIMRKFRLLYLPRMALVLSFLALSVFMMFFFGAYFNKTGFIAISIFPILIMTVLMEQFIAVQIDQGYKAAIRLTVETLALSIVGYLIGDWSEFRSLILAYPELVLLTFILNYMAGKFSGLRLTEYLRFHNVYKHIRHGKNEK